MIIGTGIDLISVARLDKFRSRHGPTGLARIFTASEVEYCLSHIVPAHSLAARFAAKEAFFKAIGTGFGRGIAWTELEVTRLESGKPELRLLGAAELEAHRRGIRRIHLTLSHTDDTAAAFVVLES
jgi:holo-[acyl-carrier protein] synthase